MISFRWETVRMFGDAEPIQLESAVRDVLAQEGGQWRVTVMRAAHEWRLRLDRLGVEPGTTPLAYRATVQSPLPAAAPLRDLLLDSLRLDSGVRTPA